MSEPVYDYYATRIVQDLEDDLYDSKERIQRLRRWNDELTEENERLRDGMEQAVSIAKRQIVLNIEAGHVEENGPACSALADLTDLTNTLTGLLEGDTE